MKLNISGAKNHPKLSGWTAVSPNDIALGGLSSEKETVDVILCSYVLEHISRDRLLFVLSEYRRVLKPDGLLRVSVPDIANAVRAYWTGNRQFFVDSEVAQSNESAPLGSLFAAWCGGDGHVNWFDGESLAWSLRKAGFTRILESAYQQSSLEELRSEGFDRHPNDSVFLEARP